MQKRSEEALKNSALFSSLTDRDREMLLQEGRIVSHRKEELVFDAFEPCREMAVVLEGEIGLRHVEKGGRGLTIGRFQKGASLALGALFAESAPNLFVEAQKKSSTLRIKKATILALCHNSAPFLDGILKEISQKTLLLSESVKRLALKTIRERVFHYLSELSREQDPPRFHLSETKTAIASMLGTSRSALTRELAKMQNDGLLVFDRKTITLTEKGQKRLAEERY